MTTRLAAIVLAAGDSRRAGTWKPAFVYRGKSLLQHAIDGLRTWCDDIVVVAAPDRCDDAAALIAGRASAHCVVNPRPEDGMFSSLQVGMRALAGDVDGIVVLPADCPLVGERTLAALVAAFAAAESAARAVVPEHAGRGGHPVLLPAAARALVLAASPRATLRDVLRDLAPRRLVVDDAAVLMDLDTAEDLRALAARGEDAC